MALCCAHAATRPGAHVFAAVLPQVWSLSASTTCTRRTRTRWWGHPRQSPPGPPPAMRRRPGCAARTRWRSSRRRSRTTREAQVVASRARGRCVRSTLCRERCVPLRLPQKTARRSFGNAASRSTRTPPHSRKRSRYRASAWSLHSPLSTLAAECALAFNFPPAILALHGLAGKRPPSL